MIGSFAWRRILTEGLTKKAQRQANKFGWGPSREDEEKPKQSLPKVGIELEGADDHNEVVVCALYPANKESENVPACSPD